MDAPNFTGNNTAAAATNHNDSNKNKQSAVNRAVVAEIRELAREVAEDENVAASNNEMDEQLVIMAREVPASDDQEMNTMVENWAALESAGLDGTRGTTITC